MKLCGKIVDAQPVYTFHAINTTTHFDFRNMGIVYLVRNAEVMNFSVKIPVCVCGSMLLYSEFCEELRDVFSAL